MSASGFDTEIVFAGELVHTRQTAAQLTVGHVESPRWGWNATASYVFGGEIEDRSVVGGGGFGLGVFWLPVYERARRPFLAVTGSAGASHVRADADDGTVRAWNAADARLGALTGKTFGPVTPYVAGRVFAGPVTWHRDGDSVLGTDRRHVTFGAGLTARLPASLDLTAEVMPLGERSAAVGLTRRW